MERQLMRRRIAWGYIVRTVWITVACLVVSLMISGTALALDSNDDQHVAIGFQSIYIQDQDLAYAPNIVFIESDDDVQNTFSTAEKATVPGIKVDFNTTDWAFSLFSSRVMVDDEEFKGRAEDAYRIAGGIARKVGDVQYISAHMDYVKLDYLMKYKPEHFRSIGAEGAPVGTGRSYVFSVLYRYEGIWYLGYRGSFSRLEYINMESERDETDVHMHMAVGGYETDFRSEDYGPFPRWLYITAELGLGGGENEFLGAQSGGSIMFGGGLQYRFSMHGGYFGVRGGYKRQYIGIGKEGHSAELEYGGPFLYVEVGF